MQVRRALGAQKQKSEAKQRSHEARVKRVNAFIVRPKVVGAHFDTALAQRSLQSPVFPAKPNLPAAVNIVYIILKQCRAQSQVVREIVFSK